MAVLKLMGEKVNVTSFSEHYSRQQMSGSPLLGDNPRTGEAWMLVIHETFDFIEQLQDSLLCPNQLTSGSHRGGHTVSIPFTFVSMDK